MSKGKIHDNVNMQSMREMYWEKVGLTCCGDSLCTTHQVALFATSMLIDQLLQGKTLVDIPHLLNNKTFQLIEGLVSTWLVLV